jgi:hypothetical protein
MEIAIAGMKNIANVKSIFFADFLNVSQRLRELGSRDDTVEHVVAWGDATERTESVFAAFPEQVAFRLIAGHSNFSRVIFAAYFFNRGSLYLDGLAQAFDFQK